jgi:hydroxypyruvate reductase
MTDGLDPLVVQMAALPVYPHYVPPVEVEVVRLWERPAPDEWLAANRDDIAALITHSGIPVSDAMMESMPKLGSIANFGVGLDAIDTHMAVARGILITHTPDILTRDVADLAIMLMLCCLRHMAEGHALVASGAWPRTPARLGQSARGKRLGIFGLGCIGREVARLGEAFEMELGYVARHPKADVTYPHFGSCRELAKWCDVLIVCAAASDETTDLVDASVLASLGPGGCGTRVARR